jgi:microcystin-dependent protein
MDAFLSFIGLWPLKWAPRNWALCWGQTIAVSENSALFALLGTTYGGDGRTTFKLPDFRGRVPIGYGQGIGLTPYQLGGRAGVEGVNLTQGQLPAHRHAATLSPISVEFKVSAEPGTKTTPATDSTSSLAGAAGKFPNSIYNSETPTANLDGISVSGGDIAVQDTGQNQYHENRQPFLVTNYIMCMEGIFPPRQ